MSSRWSALVQSIRSLLGWSKDSEQKLWKWIAELVAGSGLLGAITLGIKGGNVWLIFGLLVPILMGIAAVVAVGADRLVRGPKIGIGILKPDGMGTMFEVRVDNYGGGDAIARAYLVELTFRHGDRNPFLGPYTRLHLRGENPDQDLVVSRNTPVWIGLLEVDRSKEDNTDLWICTPPILGDQAAAYRKVRISSGPLKTHEEQHITIRVEFFNEKGERLASESKSFAIVPDEKSPMRYRAYSVGLVGRALDRALKEWDRFQQRKKSA